MSVYIMSEEEFTAKNDRRIERRKKGKYKPEGSYSRHVKWLEQNEKHRKMSQRTYERIFKSKKNEIDENE